MYRVPFFKIIFTMCRIYDSMSIAFAEHEDCAMSIGWHRIPVSLLNNMKNYAKN